MTIAAIALLAALSAAPQDDAPRVETRSEVRVISVGGPDGSSRLDADDDGVITREEFSAPLAIAFDGMDADRDGRLTTEELAAGHGEGGPGEHVIMHRGSGGPGGSGFPRVMTFRSGEGGPGGDAHVFTIRRPGGAAGEHHAGPGGRRFEIHRFGGPGGEGSVDKDSDGKVSEEEFLAPLREAFRSMDADGDGSLDEGEHHAPPAPPAD